MPPRMADLQKVCLYSNSQFVNLPSSRIMRDRGNSLFDCPYHFIPHCKVAQEEISERRMRRRQNTGPAMLILFELRLRLLSSGHKM